MGRRPHPSIILSYLSGCGNSTSFFLTVPATLSLYWPCAVLNSVILYFSYSVNLSDHFCVVTPQILIFWVPPPLPFLDILASHCLRVLSLMLSVPRLHSFPQVSYSPFLTYISLVLYFCNILAFFVCKLPSHLTSTNPAFHGYLVPVGLFSFPNISQ